MSRAIAPPFFALPSLSVLCYIASAACLLLGVGLTLAPMVGGTDFRDEAFLVTGVLHLYEFALLGLAIFLACRQAPEWDLRSVMVFLALFMVATTMSIDVLASAHPTTALLIGAATAVLGVGKVWIVQRFVATGHALPGAPLLAALLAINALMPGMLGWATEAHGVISGVPQGLWWGSGLFIMMLLTFMLVKVTETKLGAWQHFTRNPNAAVGPILLRVSTAVFLLATFIHHSVLGYTMDLGVQVGHLLPGLFALALLVCAGLRALRLLWTPIVWFISLGCVAATLTVLHTGTYAEPEMIFSYVIHPALLLTCAGLCGVLVSWRWKDQRLLRGGVIAIWVGLPLLGSTPADMQVNGDIALVLASLIIALQWWWKREHIWLYSLGGVIGAWRLFFPLFGVMDHIAQLDRAALGIASACTGPWLLAWFTPPDSRHRDLFVSALILAIGTAAWLLQGETTLGEWTTITAGTIGIAGATHWRIHRWEPWALVFGPIGYGLSHLQHVAIGWLLMLGSFLLLGLGALVSWWRVKQDTLRDRQPSNPDHDEPALDLGH